MRGSKFRDAWSAFSPAQKLAAVSTAGLFLPYFAGALLGALATLYILTRRAWREAILRIAGARYLLLLAPVALLAAARMGNLWGLAGAAVTLLAVVYALFLLAVMTEPLFEFLLRLVCLLSYFSFLIGAVQMLLIRTNSGLYHSLYLWIDPTYFGGLLKAYTAYRSMSTFYNASYFAAIASFLVLLCAYKLLSASGGRRFYLLTAAVNLGSMLLAGSRTSFLSLAVGLLVLLIFTKRYKWLACASGVALALGAALALHPAWVLRVDSLRATADKRLRIWSSAIDAFTPLGRGLWGYMDYANAHPEAEWAVHTHSLYLELPFCFGVVGCALLVVYLFRLLRAVRRSGVRPRQNVGALLAGFAALLLASGLTDVVLSGPETYLFAAFVFSGWGLYLKKEAIL